MLPNSAAQRDLDGGFTAAGLVDSGEYPAEISYYGYVWQDASLRRYIVSPDASAICQSQQELLAQGQLVSDVISYQTQRLFTSATRHTALKDVEQTLTEHLSTVYNDAYFTALSQLLSPPNTNAALPVLEAAFTRWQQDTPQFSLLPALISHAYQNKLLDKCACDRLLARCRPAAPASGLRKLSGFAWRKCGQWQYYANWWPAQVWLRLSTLTNDGLLVSPIVTKYYSLTENSGTILPKLQNAFTGELRTLMSGEYLSVVMQLSRLPSAVPASIWPDLMLKYRQMLPPQALKSLNGYAYRLHLLEPANH